MIGRLSGTLVYLGTDKLILDVNSVGYVVNVTSACLHKLAIPMDKRLTLEIHHHVRENASELYGFKTRLEHDLFEFLIGAKGVGPKLALAILSHLSGESLLNAIRAQDYRSLTAVPGLGKKKDEYLVVELRDKCEKRFADVLNQSNTVIGKASPTQAAPKVSDRSVFNDIVLGLEGMGFKGQDVDAIVRSVLADDNVSSEFSELFKRCLQRLSSAQNNPTGTQNNPVAEFENGRT